MKSSPQLHPVAHINVESKCGWHPINDTLPRFPAAPSPSEFQQLLAG
jgi:hypothetical protein